MKDGWGVFPELLGWNLVACSYWSHAPAVLAVSTEWSAKPVCCGYSLHYASPREVVETGSEN
jgi:hypothetical protein